MNLEKIWEEFQSYDGTGSKTFMLPGCRVQFYKGAMEIPLIAFTPDNKFDLGESQIDGFTDLLSSLGMELDTVEEGGNYKINSSEDHQYIGRVTPEALKLHAERIKALGWDGFSALVNFHLASATL